MGSSFDILRGWETGQIAAILNKVSGGDRGKLEALLRDDLEVSFAEKILKLVDKNGRVIPNKGLKNAVCDPDKSFRLAQPKLEIGDYELRKVRFQEAFHSVSASCPTTAEFQGRANELIGEIKKNKNISNLLNGVFLPVILPQMGNVGDYGETLEKFFLPAVKFSYGKQFPDRKFYNHRENDVANKINIVNGSRHEKLIERVKGIYVVAIYFPNPLQGFSVLASREQLSCLPESFLLAGGFDTFAAMVMYPDILARDWYTPGLDLSALVWRSPDFSLCFEAFVGWLGFDGGGDLGSEGGGYSSGLLFLGSA